MRQPRDKIVCILLIALLCASLHVYGQESAFTFKQYVQRVESDSLYRFYYNSKILDTLRVSFNPQHSIKQTLDAYFENTIFRWSVDESKNIYISQYYPVITRLPVNYFQEATLHTERVVNTDHLDFAEKRESVVNKPVVIGEKGKSKSKPTLTGYVREKATGEPIAGCYIIISNSAVSTDKYGRYSSTIASGYHEVIFKMVGMKDVKKNIFIISDGELLIEMEEEVVSLQEVVISSENVQTKLLSLDIGTIRMDSKTIKQMPLVMGEADIFKVIMTLPGVQSVGEATVGLNVRGGATDQNLILYNDAVIYNPSHLFGFFSSFNPDVVKNVSFINGGIPAEYGGRISSVLSVDTKDGNMKKVSGGGGISPITGRLSIEIPLQKDKASLVMAGRATYSDWLLKTLDINSLSKSSASFGDLSLSYTSNINKKSSLYLSGYYSKDKFRLNGDTTFQYSNVAATAKYKFIFSEKIYNTTTVSYSGYQYAINGYNNPAETFDMDYKLSQFTVKDDVSIYVSQKLSGQAGLSSIFYTIQPGKIVPANDLSNVSAKEVQRERGIEGAVYGDFNYELSRKILLGMGLRYSFYGAFGPKDVYIYQSGMPLSEISIRDTIHYDNHELISFYHGPELRFRLRYSLGSKESVKLSYNRMRQYIQMISNSVSMSPTDVWKLSDSYIKPQIGDQVSIGYYRYLGNEKYEVSIESYVKYVRNTLDYKDGAELLLNDHLETDLVNSRSKAYGIEFLVKKIKGKANGWISYTYSRTYLQTVSEYSSELVNNGEYYPSNYDKPHAINFIGNYKFSRRINVSGNIVYSTGRPITYPIGTYTINGTERLLYSERNAYRIPDYFRVDLSVNLEGNHKLKKFVHGSWSFSVYNLLGRRNPYSVFFKSENGKINSYKLSIFGEPIPTLTYNFRF